MSAWSSPVRLWLVVWVHHGREQPLQMSHFSDSLAVISGFAVTFGATVGPVTGGVLEDATSFRSGGNCSGLPRSRCRFRRMDFCLRGAHHNEGWCFAALYTL